jgi:hypothetical protein
MTEDFKVQPGIEEKSIPEELMGMPEADFARLAMTGFSNPAKIQVRVLTQILNASQETEIGKKYKFSAIRSVEDFQKQLPISEWSDVETYSERMADGEAELLFPGKAKQFVLTSGTTGNWFNCQTGRVAFPQDSIVPKFSTIRPDRICVAPFEYSFVSSNKGRNSGRFCFGYCPEQQYG